MGERLDSLCRGRQREASLAYAARAGALSQPAGWLIHQAAHLGEFPLATPEGGRLR